MLKWLLLAIGVLVIMGADRLSVVVTRMGEAIKEFEGWFPGSRSYRNNNPGNLKYAGQPGAIGADDSGHAVFDTLAHGWEALLRQIEIAFTGQSAYYSPDNTLYEFFSRYAEANSSQYAEFVGDKLGVSPNTKLKELIT